MTATECKIPQVVGAIDGTHVPIISPNTDSKPDYYCRKQMYSINTQAVVGGNLLFLDLVTGFPGSMHDARVLRHSSLYNKANNNEVLNSPTRIIEGMSVVTVHILSAYGY